MLVSCPTVPSWFSDDCVETSGELVADSHRVHWAAFYCCLRDKRGAVTRAEGLNPDALAREEVREEEEQEKRWVEEGGVGKGKDMQEEKRSKCICFNYAEKGQLLW